jgi:hypothetical protein
VIGKAVSLSEAIARSDRGPLPKIKEMMKSLVDKTKVEQVTEEISKALDQMNTEIVKSTEDSRSHKPWWPGRKKKSARERREEQLTKGTISLFSGTALMIFLYYLSTALVLKLPPDFIAKVPFEIDPVVRVIWLLGLIPAMTGLGHIIAGLLIRPDQAKEITDSGPPRQLNETDTFAQATPVSVTERTTNFLEHKLRPRHVNESEEAQTARQFD